MPEKTSEKIAVLVSGGVDSSVVLALLKAAGFDVTAFYIKIWLEDELAFLGDCPWEEDLSYVRAVTEKLGVPLEIVPLQKEYWEYVVAEAIREVRAGRTPNPDMLCNARIKFGALYDAIGDQYDKIATGHYARTANQSRSVIERPLIFQASTVSERSEEERGISRATGSLGRERARDAERDESDSEREQPSLSASGLARSLQADSRFLPLAPARFLLRSKDAVKDQTYFLSQLSSSQLSRALFPIGQYTKPEVRALAEKFGLPNAKRKDSQGICFLGKIPFDAFLKHHLGTKKGPLVEFETGKIMGEHDGFWYFTIGQREGIGLSGGPWYVVDKDAEKNIVFISHGDHRVERARNSFRVTDLNWFNEKPEDGAALSVKLRHGPKEYACQVQWLDEKTLEVFLQKETDAGVAPGQYAVFYRGEYCLGGGVIV